MTMPSPSRSRPLRPRGAARALAIALVASVALLAGCNKNEEKPATQVVAKVGKVEITVHQLNDSIRKVPPVPAEQAASANRAVLERLIDQEVTLQKAADQKLDRESRVVQKHVGMLTKRTTEFEARHLAGLPINAAIEEVDQAQGLKLNLENGAQAMTIPGIDLASLPLAKRSEALQELNGQPCTCGCDLTVARCRVDDPTCGVSLPLAQQIVKRIAGTP